MLKEDEKEEIISLVDIIFIMGGISIGKGPGPPGLLLATAMHAGSCSTNFFKKDWFWIDDLTLVSWLG